MARSGRVCAQGWLLVIALAGLTSPTCSEETTCTLVLPEVGGDVASSSSEDAASHSLLQVDAPAPSTIAAGQHPSPALPARPASPAEQEGSLSVADGDSARQQLTNASAGPGAPPDAFAEVLPVLQVWPDGDGAHLADSLLRVARQAHGSPSLPALFPLALLLLAPLVCLGALFCFLSRSPSEPPPVPAAATTAPPEREDAAAEDAPAETEDASAAPTLANWVLLCDDIVVPSHKQCTLRVPFLNEQDITNIAFSESGLPLFQVALVQDEPSDSPRCTRLVLSTPADQPNERGVDTMVLFFRRGESTTDGVQQLRTLDLMSAKGEPFGHVSWLPEEAEGSFKLKMTRGGEVTWRAGDSPSVLHVVDEAENLLAIVETQPPTRSRTITVGPRMDVALVVGCTLAGDWLCGRITQSGQPLGTRRSRE